jgi:hypothetical protein
MAESTCGCQPDDVSTESVAKTVDNQVANLDPQRAAALTGLQTARAARGAGYAREQKRLALKYGPEHPRVTALAQKTRFNEGLQRDLDFEVARAGTETPTVDKDGYVFHGFVRDLKGRGVPGLTVALYDANGNWIRRLGFGCTDERGYFLMRLQGESTTTTPPVDAPTTTTAPTATGAPPATTAPPSTTTAPVATIVDAPHLTTSPFQPVSVGRAAAAATRMAARIYVLDAKQTTLQVEKDPLYPEPGAVDFRIIILGAETAPCTPPPATPGPVTTVNTPGVAMEPRGISTPLEAIRGIGPARARKLRAAGIADIETLLRTDTAKLVEIAGFDAHEVKREAERALKKKPRKG